MREWYGLVAPSGTPAPIINRLNAVVVDILKDPKTRASFSSNVELATSSPSEFGVMIKSEMEKWKKVIVAAGLEKK